MSQDDKVWRLSFILKSGLTGLLGRNVSYDTHIDSFLFPQTCNIPIVNLQTLATPYQ